MDGATDSGSGGAAEAGDDASDSEVESESATDTDSGGGDDSTGDDTGPENCGYVPGGALASVPIGYTQSIAMGDLDGDGVSDLVVARTNHDQPGAVSVLLAEAPGEFLPPVDTVEDVAQVVALGDFDEDGALDVLSVSYPSTTYLFRHAGDGELELISETPSGNNCKDVEVGDIDADGHLDFAIMCVGAETNPTSGGVSLFRGLGDGTFEPLGGMGVEKPNGMHLVDLTGDGRLDVLASAFAPQGDPELLVYQNTDEGFVLSQSFPVTWSADAISGDFDEDGDLDVALAQEWDSELKGSMLYFENVAGELAEPVQFDTVQSPFRIGAADFDLDGHLDITLGGEGLVSVMLGDGTGSFVESAVHPSGAARRLLVTDVDDDGRMDIAYSAAGGVVIRGGEEALFTELEAFDAALGAQQIELVDLDDDGHLDVASMGEASLDVRLGDGAGGFSASWAVELEWAETRGITAGDVDGDGQLDLVTAREDGVQWYAGSGDGTFAAAQSLSSGAATGVPRFADLDADGVDDVIVPRSNGVLIALASGEDVPFNTVSGVVAPMDVDGDGTVDLIAAGGTLRVSLGTGSAAFADSTEVEAEDSIADLVLADLDGDGDLDAVSVGPHVQAGATFRGLTAFENNDGDFSPSITTLPVGIDIHGLAAADLNADGYDDIVTYEHKSTALSVWLGPDLEHAGVFPIGGFPKAAATNLSASRDGITVGDVDEDGVEDVLVADPYRSRVVVLRGALVTGEACES